MALWMVFAVLTAVTILTITAPLLKGLSSREQETPEEADASDEEVYRSQLREIEAERAQGLLAEAEYAAARVEVSRRLLHAAQERAAAPAKRGTMGAFSFGKAAAYAVVAAFPAASVALYLHYGAPDLPGQPLQARLSGPLETQSVEALVFQVEERLRQHPEDGVGWSVAAPVYLKLGRYEDAAEAFGQAIRLQGETAGRLLGRGEALTLAGQGAVSQEARAAFARALDLDPDQHVAALWLALGHEQDGRWDKAADAYRALLGRTALPADVRATVGERLKVAEARAAQPAGAAAAGGGPTAADVQAAQQMTGAERAAMVGQMVQRLAARLEQNGNDLAGWLKLVRAYHVLGRRDDALKALSSARQSFSGDAEALARIDDLARALGLNS